MALLTSGALDLSLVVAEFGGVAPHDMSEYYALAGLGVTGLPSSGVFDCSLFYGKSNQVITSVWTSSGYNDTVLTSIGQIGGSSASGYASHSFSGNNGWQSHMMIAGVFYSYAARWVGGIYYVPNAGAYNWSQPLNRYQNVTTWIDTSAYQNTTTTAQITT
jgi:hypothetical protein